MGWGGGKLCQHLNILILLLGGSTSVNAGWSPRPVEIEIYEPKLTNAFLVITSFQIPNIVHRQRRVGLFILNSNENNI